MSARGFLDHAPIEFPCPKCGRKVRQTIGDGRRNKPIRCPGGHSINVDGSGLDAVTRQVERRIDDMSRKLK